MPATYTYEGNTKMPVYPTSAIVVYGGGTMTVDTGADWADVGAGNDLTPNANLSVEVLNDSPVKITPNNAGDYVDLWPGVWRADVHINGICGVASIIPRIAVVDSVAGGAHETFIEFDQDNLMYIPTGNADVMVNGLIAISAPTDIRLCVADKGQAGGSWNIKLASLHLKRICDYVAT